MKGGGQGCRWASPDGRGPENTCQRPPSRKGRYRPCRGKHRCCSVLRPSLLSQACDGPPRRGSPHPGSPLRQPHPECTQHPCSLTGGAASPVCRLGPRRCPPSGEALGTPGPLVLTKWRLGRTRHPSAEQLGRHPGFPAAPSSGGGAGLQDHVCPEAGEAGGISLSQVHLGFTVTWPVWCWGLRHAGRPRTALSPPCGAPWRPRALPPLSSPRDSYRDDQLNPASSALAWNTGGGAPPPGLERTLQAARPPCGVLLGWAVQNRRGRHGPRRP